MKIGGALFLPGLRNMIRMYIVHLTKQSFNLHENRRSPFIWIKKFDKNGRVFFNSNTEDTTKHG